VASLWHVISAAEGGMDISVASPSCLVLEYVKYNGPEGMVKAVSRGY